MEAVSEFNMFVDAEAAKIVFESGIPIYMVPLEVTHTVLATNEVIQRIGDETRFCCLMKELLLFIKAMYLTEYEMDDPPLHDPCAVALIIKPEMFKYEKMRVDIEVKSELSYGQTVCDLNKVSQKEKNCFVCLEVDAQQFWTLLIETLKKIDKNSLLNQQN
jgi:inosine-uridine nucleoside N-ribohydrolase